MTKYLFRRLLSLIPTIFGITIIVFVVMRLIPGDPIENMLGTEYDEEIATAYREELGLDQPVLVQYLRWLGKILQGDLGESIGGGRSVAGEILDRLPVSLELVLFAMIFAILVALPAGIISASRPHSKRDYASMVLALLGICIPGFFLGILLMLVFGMKLDWLPTSGYTPFGKDPVDHFVRMILPAIALGAQRSAILTRLIRASMLDALQQDYIIFARAKGVAETVILNLHALKNALIPTVTMVGLQIGYMLGGSIIIETLFGIPGLGSFGVQAIYQRDYPNVQGFMLVMSLVFVVSNLVVDLLYRVLDPQIRYEQEF